MKADYVRDSCGLGRMSKHAKKILDRLAYGSSQSAAIESLLMGAEG